ncbi:MAG: DNA polymerase/3'-5' exonuclease PolX [Sediminibacterium sp.]|nr:DNA polymerase/3'-5' exonuclease PolX [Sediminibacterium sp.]
MHNYEIAEYFSLLAKLMDIHGENAFKIKSYSNAAYTLDRLNDPLEDMTLAQIASIRGIGEALAQKIVDLLATKKLQILEEYIQKTPAGILEMLKIKGLGPKKIITIWKELGIESIGELLYACEENRLINYKGFGAKTQQSIQDALNYYLQNQGSFLYQQVQETVAQIENALTLNFPTAQYQVSGYYKRQMETLDFLDIVSTAPLSDLKTWLQEKGFILAETPDYLSCKGPDNFELRWYMVDKDKFFIQDFILSCSPEFWAAWQILPNFDATKAFASELAIFEQVAIPFIPAAQREEASIIQQASTKGLNKVIQASDIRGIIHSHSTWSDGLHTIEQMAVAAKAQGLEYLVISDHSKSAFYANGLQEDRIRAQHKEIDLLNKKLAPFVIFKSIESDILNDGSLDYPDEILDLFDLVIASVHSNLKMTEEKAMMRLMNAIENPYTSILGHATGRLLLSRKGYPINHEAIISACAEHNVVIELNAHPRRLDMDWRYIHQAMEQDVLISINPDAHAIDGFDDCKYGVLVAQKAGLTAAQNLSSFSLSEMMEFISYQQAKRN